MNTMTELRVKEFQATLTTALGMDAVSDEDKILFKYEHDRSSVTGITGQKPVLVVWPKTTEEVRLVVQTAIKCAISLVPVSSGPDWRLHGDTIPKVPNSVIVDLSRMNRILRIDRTNRVVMVEPGVTFAQLIPEIDKQGLRLLHPLIPRNGKSVLASALEREPTTIPRYHWDTSDPLLCTETIFGTGDLFRTGTAAGPGSIEEQLAMGQAQKNPMGPTQFNLFQTIQGAQGTLGIVTWATLKCELKPTQQKILFAQADTFQALEDFAAGVLKFRIGDEVFIMNKLAFAAFIAPPNSQQTTPEEAWKEWIMPITLAGRGIFAGDKITYLEADIRELGQKNAVLLQTELKGVDTNRVLSFYQETSEEPWPNRLAGLCQSVFCITTLDRVALFAEEVKKIVADQTQVHCGFYIQPLVQGCNCHFEVQLYYENNSMGGPAVKSAFKRVTERIFDLGGFFSRPYYEWAAPAFERVSPENVAVLNKIKNIFDPHHVLKPGALCFKQEET